MRRVILTLVLTLSGMAWAVGGNMGNGDGSEANPYLIEDLADFDAFAGNFAYWAAGVHTKLMTDIDLSGRTYTTAVIAPDIDNSISGFQGTEFTGVFDGNTHIISNLTISASSKDFIGLFGAADEATIQNLGLKNISISSGDGFIGGMVGDIFSGSLTNCFVTGSVNGYSGSGGLVGVSWAKMANCYSTANVSGTTGVGGLVGVNFGNMTNCYSTGNVSGNDEVGGLVGINEGFLVVVGSVTNCYSIGMVSSSDRFPFYVGGLIGVSRGTVAASFWDTQTSGQLTSGGGTGKTTTQMKTLSTFTSAGWDFETPIWMITGQDYPRLIWNNPDIDSSGKVNLADFSILAGKWMEMDCGFCDRADLTGDRNVSLSDLLVLAAHYLEITLAGHWKLDDAAGTIALDSSGNSRDGTLINGPVWSSPGELNGALEFDGVDDYVEIIGYKGITGGNSRTCCMWIKTAVADKEILSWGSIANNGNKWIVLLDAAGHLRISVAGGYIVGSSVLTDNQWHHIAIVLENDGSPDISEAKLYVNGQTEIVSASDAQLVDTGNVQNVQIGVCEIQGNYRYFQGLIDDVRIYKKALSNVQIEQIYQVK